MNFDGEHVQTQVLSEGSAGATQQRAPVRAEPRVRPASKTQVSSTGKSRGPSLTEAARSCTWEAISVRWGVSPFILYSIAKTESSLNPRAVNKANANGSEDVGMMQINSFWFPKLASYGISRNDLFDPCVSLEVAGWILSQNMDRHGNTWKAIGAYNAVTPSKQLKYAERVFQNLPDHVRTAR